ncbi:hypothetical protein M9458_029408, partial [Cirrhinus mrigala]
LLPCRFYLSLLALPLLPRTVLLLERLEAAPWGGGGYVMNLVCVLRSAHHQMSLITLIASTPVTNQAPYK